MQAVWRAVILVLASPPPALADDCRVLCIAYELTGEVEDDWLFSTRPSSLQSNDPGPEIDFTADVIPLEHLKLVGGVTAEPVLDKPPSADRAFLDIGAYVHDLHAELAFDPVTVRWGKFEPEFRLATHKLDGIFATGLVGDYDNEERWGAESSFEFKAFGLSHALTASAFTTDRTFLSKSVFVNRGRTRLSDGGAGNAEGIASLAAVLDGCKGVEPPECYETGMFGYRVGVRHQTAGHPAPEHIEDEVMPRDETAVLAALTARSNFDEAILHYLGEVAYISHFDGGAEDALTGTASASLVSGAMTYMATYSQRRVLRRGEADTAEHLFDLTAAYDLNEDYSLASEKWTLAAAYGCSRGEDGETAHAIGLTIKVDFATTANKPRSGSED